MKSVKVVISAALDLFPGRVGKKKLPESLTVFCYSSVNQSRPDPPKKGGRSESRIGEKQPAACVFPERVAAGAIPSTVSSGKSGVNGTPRRSQV